MPAFLPKDEAVQAIQKAGLEEQFLKEAGLTSLDELDPAKFEGYTSFRQHLVVKTDTPAPQTSSRPASKEDADAPPPKADTSASGILLPYLTTGIVRHNQLRPSFYHPSAFMMYYVLHQMNDVHCDNFYFKRYCPDYHPYVLRLYYGIIFIVQTLRAQKTVTSLSDSTHQFLVRFLDAFDPSTLPVAGPLVPIFKTICSSTPELSNLGLVYPRLPSPIGPRQASHGTPPTPEHFIQPAITAIFDLLHQLNELTNAVTPSYPKKGWTPFLGRSTPVTFSHVHFPVERTATQAAPAISWTDDLAWSLTRPGIEYPCEASKALNESFAERYDNFDFPTFDGTTNVSSVSSYLGMSDKLEWFSLVRQVAAKAAAYTEGSGTLADCSPQGLKAGQTLSILQAPDILPIKPTYAAVTGKKYVELSLLTFSYRLSTTVRSPDQLAETMSAYAQTNIRGYATHPYHQVQFIGSTTNSGKVGPFWALRPVFKSPVDDSAYLSIREYVDKATKTKL